MSANTLIELGTEELPPKALSKLLNAFQKGVSDGLQKAGVEFEQIDAFGGPRRLALMIKQLHTQQADQKIERRGPATQAGFDAEGNPSRALQGFAKSVNADIDSLEKETTDKGEYFVFRGEKKGQPVADLLPGIVQNALKQLPIPKMMRWADLEEEFVRPVQWLVMLHGDQVIDAELYAVQSGRLTFGHRFHHPDAIELKHADDYLAVLENAFVLANQQIRRYTILAQVKTITDKKNAKAVLPHTLLEEINQIVEWPQALLCQFDESFLTVPAECLITALQQHQKCIALTDQNDQLLPAFIAVSNIKSKQPERVVSGNETVVAARLSDAKFFFETDLKTPLGNHQAALEKLTFQAKLGSMMDKAKRTATLAEGIASQCQFDAAKAKQAGLLTKADLVTEMVMEFPELQGIMGEHYARHQGLDADVASALNEQYQPRFSGDVLPDTQTGIALSLADKLDTLVAIFGINQKPTGSKDPFALRRAAIGLIRLLIEKKLPLDLAVLIDQAAAQLGEHLSNETVSEDVIHFCFERLKQHYVDQGVSIETFEAVRANKPTNFADFDQRIQAVLAFEQLPEADAIAAANKRVNNILNKQGSSSDQVEESLLTDEAEQKLFKALSKVKADCQAYFDDQNYADYLKNLAQLKEPVDTFFDQVMVMADDGQLRQNRLSLLQNLKQLFGQCADLALLSR